MGGSEHTVLFEALIFLFLAVSLGSCCISHGAEHLHPRWEKLMQEHCTHNGVGLDFIRPFVQVHDKNSLSTQTTCGEGATESECMILKVEEGDSSSCPSQASSAMPGFQQKRSLCPWTFQWTYNADRYPHNFAEAHCLCHDGCLTPDVSMKSSTSCEPVYYNIPILQRNGEVDDDGIHCRYEQKFHKLPVGCTCASKPSQ